MAMDPLTLQSTDDCQLPYGCWRLNLGPLKELIRALNHRVTSSGPKNCIFWPDCQLTPQQGKSCKRGPLYQGSSLKAHTPPFKACCLHLWSSSQGPGQSTSTRRRSKQGRQEGSNSTCIFICKGQGMQLGEDQGQSPSGAFALSASPLLPSPHLISSV